MVYYMINLKLNIMSATNTQTPVIPANLDTEGELLKAKTAFNRIVFENLNGDKARYLSTLTGDGSTRKAKQQEIASLFNTGLLGKEELVDVLSRMSASKEGVLQISFINSWLTSKEPPSKESCVSLMNTFASEDNTVHLMLEIMLTRQDITLQVISEMLIEGKVPFSDQFYLLMLPNLERLKSKAIK